MQHAEDVVRARRLESMAMNRFVPKQQREHSVVHVVVTVVVAAGARVLFVKRAQLAVRLVRQLDQVIVAKRQISRVFMYRQFRRRELGQTVRATVHQFLFHRLQRDDLLRRRRAHRRLNLDGDRLRDPRAHQIVRQRPFRRAVVRDVRKHGVRALPHDAARASSPPFRLSLSRRRRRSSPRLLPQLRREPPPLERQLRRRFQSPPPFARRSKRLSHAFHRLRASRLAVRRRPRAPRRRPRARRVHAHDRRVVFDREVVRLTHRARRRRRRRRASSRVVVPRRRLRLRQRV